MKYLFLLALFFPLCAAADQNAHHGFAGSWLWAEGEDRFSLILEQKGSTLTGHHSATKEDGRLGDNVPLSQPPSITGEVHDTTVVVRFKSGAPGSEAWGHARMTLRDRYLYWQLMDATGTHYLPENAVLIRQER